MKVTLITGASSGIGEAIARKLAERKNNLLLVARNEKKLQKQSTQLSQTYEVQVEYIATDLTKRESIELIYHEALKRGLEVDCLINNAGVGSGGEFTELSLQSELSMMQLNMNSLVAMTHYFLTDMKKRRKGTIVNVASMAAFLPTPYMAVYAASKVFVRSFTEAITEECKPYNVRVMLLCPGFTRTNFMSASGIDNIKGEALTSGVKSQTSDEVADEAIRGLEKGKSFVVSGINIWLAKSLSLIPNVILAKSIAKSYHKKMKI